MTAFVDKYDDRIHGVLSCFDRMLFRGYLPTISGWSMAQLLQAHEIDSRSVKPFLLANVERVKAHAQALARQHGRPFEYLSSALRKENAARKIAERENIDKGLVCVFSALEPGFNPLAQEDATLFKSLMAGEHFLHSFTNRNFRARLMGTKPLGGCANDPKSASGRPMLPTLACPRPDRQDPAHQALACR